MGSCKLGSVHKNLRQQNRSQKTAVWPQSIKKILCKTCARSICCIETGLAGEEQGVCSWTEKLDGAFVECEPKYVCVCVCVSGESRVEVF